MTIIGPKWTHSVLRLRITLEGGGVTATPHPRIPGLAVQWRLPEETQGQAFSNRMGAGPLPQNCVNCDCVLEKVFFAKTS